MSVTAVCGGENSELVISLGADKIIDYKSEDFTKDNGQYDFIINTIPGSSFSRCKRLLKKHGMYLPSDGFQNLFLAPISRLLGGKKVVFLMPKNINAGLAFIKDLVNKGSFKPVIDRTYPIDKIVEAYTYVATGQKIGNVIITMDA